MNNDYRMLRVFALALAAAAPVTAALAVDKASPALSSTDQEFLRKAALGGMTEVQAAQTAQTQATIGDVKQLGVTMEKDHTKANDELKSLAGKNGWTLPSSLDAEHQGKLDALTAKNGHDFDDAFADTMVKDHQATIDLFKQESETTQVASLRDFTKKTLPTLEHHLKMSQDVEQKVQKK